MSKHNQIKSLSKFLAVMLRHKPENFGLTLDEQGFVPLDAVWQQIQQRYGKRYNMEDVQQVVAGDKNGKKRYEIVGDHIRAMYGHSHVRTIAYPTAVPPETLYHGTNVEAMAAIREEGLKAMERQFVHLTTNPDNAQNVAKRRTAKPVMLAIRALEAHNAGHTFHHAEKEHYLVQALPPEFINFPEV